jgi:hypothetical protein
VARVVPDWSIQCDRLCDKFRPLWRGALFPWKERYHTRRGANVYRVTQFTTELARPRHGEVGAGHVGFTNRHASSNQVSHREKAYQMPCCSFLCRNRDMRETPSFRCRCIFATQEGSSGLLGHGMFLARMTPGNVLHHSEH